MDLAALLIADRVLPNAASLGAQHEVYLPVPSTVDLAHLESMVVLGVAIQEVDLEAQHVVILALLREVGLAAFHIANLEALLAVDLVVQ